MNNKEEKQRTNLQNRALHLYYSNLAKTLNAAGIDMRKFLKQGVDITWSGYTVKEKIWRPIQFAQLGKESTVALTTKEIDLIYDTLNKHLGENHYIHESFPCIEQLILDHE